MPPSEDAQTRYAAALRLMQAGRMAEARTALTALLASHPDSPEIRAQLARIAHEEGDFATRADHLDRALAARPGMPALLDAAVAAFADAGRVEDALAAHDARIAAARKPLHAAADKGIYLQRIGRFDEAEALFRELIARAPFEGVLYRTFLATHRLAADDPLMGRLRKAANNPKVGDETRVHALFALAKALEDQGAHDEVFPVLHRANRLQRRLAPYDRAAREAEDAAIRAAQDRAALDPIDLEAALAPVFVTGMPRSGTTLAEQIVGAHPDATAGGELALALRLAHARFAANGRLAALRSLKDPDLARYAASYLHGVRRATGARRGTVTDKSIQSHLVYGYLARALPGARFVVIDRDPRDVALSIYKTHFALGTHRYANDLADIAAAIKAFRASVAAWQDRLGDRLVRVAYEDLVGDPEPAARRLVAAAGLDWDPACLTFHERGGAVRTLSIAQVRQPIHGGRRAAWRRYETEMQPFIDAWGDDPWD
ncbi:tetratricopeptide repeat-containing sulfotransferase family protein [Roseivivax isoporae]|nr:sulfotransferase [Roseivivax isoporae]